MEPQKQQEKKRNFYTTKEVIEVVFDGNISMTTIHKLINDEKIPCVKLCKKKLIPASWVEKEIAKGHVQF